MPRIPSIRPGATRPKRKRSKRPKPKRHYAVLISRRTQTYGCPTCGPLGDLAAGVAHAVANQFIYEDPQP